MNLWETGTITINNSLNFQGGGRGSLVTIQSSVPGSQARIFMNGLPSYSVDYASITDINIDNGSANTYTATNSIDGGGNNGWIFQNPLAPLEYYWIGGEGNWSDVNHWEVGGVAATEGPSQIDNVNFTTSSFGNPGTLTIDQPTTINSMTWETGSGINNPVIFADWGNSLTIMGDFLWLMVLKGELMI